MSQAERRVQVSSIISMYGAAPAEFRLWAYSRASLSDILYNY